MDTIVTSSSNIWHVKSLVNATSTALVSVNPLAVKDKSFCMKLFFMVECTDGTDAQVREGDCNAVLVNKASVYTTTQALTTSGALTGGTLTVTIAWDTTGPRPLLKVTATTSLAPALFKIHYRVFYATHSAYTYISA
jgi:hypothetical protein